MKILIIGKEGMLGDDLAKKYRDQHQVEIVGEERLDFCRSETIKPVIVEKKPDVVINCAAVTNLDLCEREPELAFKVNAAGPGELAKICADEGCRLVHISTDYVFGDRPDIPYEEDEEPNPASVYSESKLEGERKVMAALEKHLIVRAAWVFGFKDKSFVRFILRKGKTGEQVPVLDDQTGSVTYTMDIGEGIGRLL